MGKKYIFILFVLLSSVVMADTDSNVLKNNKEICINSNSLLRQFIPFNLSSQPDELTSIRIKWYGKKYALRTNLGLNIEGGSINRNFVSLGFERRRDLFKKFTYTSGWDYFLLLDSKDPGSREVGVSIGPSKFFGLEYNINNRLFLGTEAHIMLGLGEPFKVITQAPTSIFACIRL
jgi:hypothetical protein